MGQLHGPRRRRARPQGQADRRAPGQAAQLPASRQAGRALVHRLGHGHGHARRHGDHGARRESRSTSRWQSAHRIANEGDTDVVFIEVQRGTYFGEDDIVRLEDDYGGGLAVTDADRELLAAGPTYSFEFFPPKNDKELDHARPHHRRAAAARAVVRVGHLPRRRRVTPAHLRPRVRHAAHDQAQPDGPPHLRGAHPPGVGRHPGVAAQGGRGEPHGSRRRHAAGPVRAPASWLTRRSSSSSPVPSAASPSEWPPTPPATRAPRACPTTGTTWPPSSSWPTSG